ncbi:THO1 Protein THO1 [Candida maltosa Xu316]
MLKHGLSIDGKKAELVQRLEEFDSSQQQQQQQPEQPEAEQPAAAVAEHEESKPEDANPVESTDGTTKTEDESTLTVIQPKQKEEEKKLSPEEIKKLAIEHLETKVKRAEKFGDEDAANEAKKALKRVEKFGVELGTALAREIGLVDKSLSDKKKNFRRGGGFKGKNKNRKNRK